MNNKKADRYLYCNMGEHAGAVLHIGEKMPVVFGGGIEDLYNNTLTLYHVGLHE